MKKQKPTPEQANAVFEEYDDGEISTERLLVMTANTFGLPVDEIIEILSKHESWKEQ